MSANETAPYVFSQTGTFNAPFEFDVPASLAIRPDTAHATFDGSGAGADFLACLSFYDSNGNLLGRMFNPTPVTAGDTAQVTYIPPFGSAASSSTGPSTPPPFQVDVSLVWGATAGFYSFPSNDDGIKATVSAVVPPSPGAVIVEASGTYVGFGTGTLVATAINHDSVSHTGQILWATVQQIGANTREVTVNASTATLLPGTPTALPWNFTGNPNTLMGSGTSTAPTFNATNPYAVSAMVQVF